MRELELIKSLESDNRELELLAIYFEEAVSEITLVGCLPMSGREKADQLRKRIAENQALIEQITSTALGMRGCFNGAAMIRSWKSSFRTTSAMACTCFNVAEVKRPRKCRMVRPSTLPIMRFNGAAMIRSRKSFTAQFAGEGYTELQCGRDH